MGSTTNQSDTSSQLKVKYLVADTGAFLHNAQLHQLTDCVHTVPEVIAEVKSRWALEQLQVLPYQIEVLEPDDEDLKFVTSFSKKTGDYFTLSDTDLKVMALAIHLERKHHAGKIDHLQQAPRRTTIVSNVPKKKAPEQDKLGFNFKHRAQRQQQSQDKQSIKCAKADSNGLDVLASNLSSLQLEQAKNDRQVEKQAIDDEAEDNQEDEGWQSIKPYSNRAAAVNQQESSQKTQKDVDAEYVSDEDDFSTEEDDESGDEFYNEDGEEFEVDEAEFNLMQSTASANSNEDEEDTENHNQDTNNLPELYNSDDDDDDGDWIKPSNIDFVKKQFQTNQTQESEYAGEIPVACMTGDFSMQNVLMQIGIHILSVQKGLLIRHTRQFVLRCIACFKVTSSMGKMFCPSCGNLKTLKKVSVSVDEHGQKRIHLNPKRPITTRDVKLRIPRPRRGRNALNPILAPDQHVPRFKASKLASQEKKAISKSILTDVDYLVRDNPFSINDVYSKSSRYRIGNRAAVINKAIFNEGRKYANKRKDKRRN